MKIHKEGHIIICRTVLFWIVSVVAAFLWLPCVAAWSVACAGVLSCLFVMRFFRVPKRPAVHEEGAVYAPADGQVVIVEEAEVKEYLGERRIQVSIFMSIWNVHVNWFPVGGTVVYFKHHPGKYLVAWHPKSSELNERTTVVVEMGGGRKILFRQIAGMVARRIVSHAKVGEPAAQNSECGIIKFGSRVDVFLPLDARVCVEKGDKVTGTQTVIARL